MKHVRIIDFTDYKKYLKALISLQVNEGRGQYGKIATHLGVHSTLVSQILSGSKDFSLEQAIKLASFFEMNELEAEYFLLLVHQAKAGTVDLKEYYEKRLTQLKDKFQNVSERVRAKESLQESDKAFYYSDWKYMAVWLSTMIPDCRTIEAISKRTDISPMQVIRIMEFLISTGLCIEQKNGYHIGIRKTHLKADSPLITRHHTNWRLKAIEQFPKLTSEELAFSSPLTISKKDFQNLKLKILDMIEEVSEKVKTTSPEELACLNIDFFYV